MGSTEAATLLESLPARPPTPPRDTAHDTNLAAKSKKLLARPPILGVRSTLQTPPNLCTPDSSTANSTNPSRSRKRVGFSARAEYKEAPTYTDAAKRSSPPSASQPRPVKGILKPPSASEPRELSLLSESTDAADGANIFDMLESAVKQLAGADRDAKIDAYTMIVRSLQASKNLPDRIALRDKMSLFLQFIQRDILVKNSAGALDTPLVTKALTMLDTFLFFPAIASTIPSDFGVFIIDHCIRSFEDQTIPKDLARRLLHVVAMQDFSQRVLTSDRVRRLIAALHGMDGHLRGKSIVVYRLRVYHRLIQKAQPYMATHTEWLNDVFTDMLSPIKDIRNSAIKLGSEAAFIYGKEQQLSRRVLELMDASIEEMTYIEWYREQLLTMTKGADKAVVPQIWSVVVLLIRVSLCRWRFFNPWLHLIQNCFNSTDLECNREANFAWNRFVYTLHFDERNFSSPKMFSTLLQPIAVQLRKAGISEQKRETVFGGLCNLYYYAFRPTANQAHIDMYWDISVKPLTDTLVPTKKSTDAVDDHFRRASVILTGLFDSKTQIWRDDRIKDSIVPRPEELPMIDPKWVRRNATKVFSVLTPIMDRQFCQLSDKTSPVSRLWRSLVNSVALAASKEIKVSNDTATFISETFGLLLKYWQVGLPNADPEMAVQFLLATQDVVLTVVEKLGVLPFTERMISLGRLSSFMPVSTPSHKPGKNLGDVRTPLQHLFGLVTRLPPGIPDDETYLHFLQSIFSPFFTTSKSAKARSDLANEMLQSVPIWSPQTSQYPYGPWVFVSEHMIAAMSGSQSSVHSSGDATLGHEYRSIVRLLERGWRETPNLPWEHWQALYAALANRASGEAGDAGRAVGVIEPLAKMIREYLGADNSAVPNSTLKVAAELVSTATQPRDRQALDAARRRLWGTAITGGKITSFDPFDHLYKLTNDLLVRFYDSANENDANPGVFPLIAEVATFLARSNDQLSAKATTSLEDGIATWVHDKRGLMSSHRDAEQAEALWTIVCNIIFSDGKPQLETFEKILCAGLESKHRHVVNIVAQAWNKTFEGAETLEYPANLKAVLLSSQTFVDLVLPGLAAPPTPSEAQGRSFVESQDAPREISLASSRSLRRSIPRSSANSDRSASPGIIKRNVSEKRRADGTSRRVRSSNRSTPTSRLRHNNSQLQFVAVESSPSVDQAESQNLTDHQKEVRERQLDAAAIYPVLRSSPRRKSRESSHQPSAKAVAAEKVVEQQKESTPEPRSGFEDYVSSTPTPRRGQALAIDLDDHDMMDPPSSPPEPRPFPLLPQIKSRSSSRGEMDDEWPLSSSPVNSPTVEPVQAAENEVPVMDIADELMPTTEDSQPVVEDSFPMSVIPSSAPMEPAILAHETSDDLPQLIQGFHQEPSTPRHRHAIGEETGPAQEAHVDAPANLQPTVVPRRSSRRADAEASPNDSSFVVSDGDERSMLRLVVELDSRRCEIPMSDHPAQTPPKRERPGDVEDCITVAESPKKRARKSKSKSPAAALAPTEETAPPTEKSGKKKRKRSSSSKQERRKKRKSDESGDESSLPSSQSSIAEYWSDAAGDNEKPRTDIYSSSKVEGVEPPSPARSEGKDTDTELESQLVAEQEAHSQSQAHEPALDAVLLEDNEELQLMELDPAAQDSDTPTPAEELQNQLPAQAQQPETSPPQEEPTVMEHLAGILGKLQSAALPRDEVNKVEDMLMDIKRALYAAEERGRQ